MPNLSLPQTHAGIAATPDHSRLYISLLLAGLLFFVCINLAIFYKNLNDNLEVLKHAAGSNTKTELAFSMREAMQLRWLSLNTMLRQTSAFARDEELQHFYQHAQLYRSARDELYGLSLTPDEQKQLDTITQLTTETQPVIEKLANAIFINTRQPQLEQLLSQARLAHGILFNAIYDFIELQRNYSDKAHAEAITAYRRSVTLLALLSMAGFLFTVLLVLLTRRYMLAQNRRLSITTQERTDFVATICHEIKTPLSAIYSYSENLLGPGTTRAQGDKAIAGIRRNALFLQNLINNTLDLSKLESGELTIETATFSLTDLLEEVQTMLGRIAEEKGLYFRIQYLPPIPHNINSDTVRLKQILINLVQNAIKFTRSGGISINVSCDMREQLLYLDIIDTGIGMTREQQDRIFSPDAQTSLGTLREFGSTGLGLYLSRELVEYLNGRITVESSPGAGSRFTIALPTGMLGGEDVLSSIPDSLDAEQHSKRMLTYRRFHGKILLADDTSDNQALLSMYVSHTSASTTNVDNGNDAVQLAMKMRFDLILLDIELPGLNAVAAAERIREQGHRGPILALTSQLVTALENPEYQIFDAIIHKPVTQEAFLSKLALYLPIKDKAEGTTPDLKTDAAQAKASFLSLIPERVHSLNTAAAGEDTQLLHTTLHKIKAAASRLGYDEIYNLCEQVEITLPSQVSEPGRLASILVPLITALNKLTQTTIDTST